MAFIPDGAILRGSKLSPSANWLYQFYCMRRDHERQACFYDLQAARAELGLSRSAAYAAQKELLVEGWIQEHPDGGVRLLVGDFSPVDERAQRRREIRLAKLSSGAGNSPETWTEQSSNQDKKSSFQDNLSTFQDSHYKDVSSSSIQHSNPAAAAHAREDAPAPPPARVAPLEEVCTDQTVERAKASGAYSSALVDHVWSKLKLRCSIEGCAPTVSRFLTWLSTEKGTPPATAPARAAPAAQLTQEELKLCETSCVRCHGSGFETVQGKGARPCPNRGKTQERKEATG